MVGASLRTTVTLLNILSSLASLGMLWLGSRIVSIGLPSLENNDYRATAIGLVIVAAFLTFPPVCVAASAKLARQNSRSSIFISLIPLAVVTAVIMAAPAALLVLVSDD
jgi:hypothetical protein